MKNTKNSVLAMGRTNRPLTPVVEGSIAVGLLENYLAASMKTEHLSQQFSFS